MGTVVGIDPGLHCGYAVIDEDTGDRIDSGVWELKTTDDGLGMIGLRLRRHLLELLGTGKVVALAYEDVARHAGTKAAHKYGGIIQVVTMTCDSCGMHAYTGIPVGTIKKTATGKGNASKGAMVDAAMRRFGIVLPGEDEADALWIAETLRRQL